MAKDKRNSIRWIKKNKWWLLGLGILWVVVAVVSWFKIPGWQGRPGGIWELIGASTPGVVSIVSSLVGIFRKPEGKTIIMGDLIGRDQWNIYLSAPGRGKLSQSEFREILKQYLEWVSNYYSKARLWGLESLQVTGDKPVRKLADVFVPLSLCRFTPPTREEIEQLAGQGASGLDHIKVYVREIERRQSEGSPVDLRELLSLRNLLAVIGGPGCGKSTLISFIAASLASNQSGKNQFFKLPEDHNSLVPLVIPLRDFALYKRKCAEAPEGCLSDPHAGTLVGFIFYTLQKITGMDLSRDFFERLLLGGGCLVMLDGLDEVVNRDERAMIRQAVENLSTGYPKNIYLVTAREAGYTQDAVFGDDFLRLDVKRLENPEIETLVTNWCKQLYPESVDTNVKEMIEAINEINSRSIDSDLPPLVSTPLMVTMVISVNWGKTELPKERAKLYDAAIEVILQAQYTPLDEARKEVVDWGGPWDEQRDWLALLAYEMHSSGKGGAAIPEEQVREILSKTIDSSRLDRFIQAVRSRGGLFEERAELFQFIHLSFQEFLAARWIAKQRDEGLKNLADHLPDSWWREVFLLTYGFALKDHRPFAGSYLKWLSGYKATDEIGLSGLELAGAALLEIENASPEMQQELADKISIIICDCKCEATAVVRARAGDTLARLGDPRPEVMTVDGMRFCFVPAGEFWYSEGNEARKENLPDFWLAEYPVSHAQYRAFLAEDGYLNGAWWPEARKDGRWSEQGLKGKFGVQPRTAPVPYGERFDLPNHPVVGVSWYEAMAFTHWLTVRWQEKQLLPQGWQISLPNEKQWEKAARGGLQIPAAPHDLAQELPRIQSRTRPDLALQPNPVERREFPWAGGFDANNANAAETGIGATSALGCFPLGVSPYGIQELSGSVWEWQNNWVFEGEQFKVIRGGSWLNDQNDARVSFRFGYFPDDNYSSGGFRCVLSPTS